MSTEFFEIFIRTEICRHPSLGPALQLKSNLRRCSIQFESAFAELHYRLIKAAVQQLFSRVSSVRLHELSSGATSSCETKYVITDSTQRSPNSRSSQATEAEQCSSRNDAQSNNSQGLRRLPRTPARRNHRGGCQPVKVHNHASSRWPNTSSSDRVKDDQLHSPPCQQCQQPTCPPLPKLTCQPHLNQNPTKSRPRPITRDGPSCSYPTLSSHNRLAMAGWYVANMDALLSNLMRLFEMIYRDTRYMCGIGACDMRDLRNAIPDPTLLSMQQRTSGHWRPNFMNCKIDFLLHIAAMVYRNTQDLRSGCTCNIPADPCMQYGVPLQFPHSPSPPPPPPQQPRVVDSGVSVNQCWPSTGGNYVTKAGAPSSHAPMNHSHNGSPGCGANRNNATALSQGHCACECCDHQQQASGQTPEPVSSEKQIPQLLIISPCKAAVAAAADAIKTANSHQQRGRRRKLDSTASRSPVAGCRCHRPLNISNNNDGVDSADRKLQKHVNCAMALLSKTYARVRSTSTSRGGAGSSEGETDTGSTCLSVDIKIPQ